MGLEIHGGDRHSAEEEGNEVDLETQMRWTSIWHKWEQDSLVRKSESDCVPKDDAFSIKIKDISHECVQRKGNTLKTKVAHILPLLESRKLKELKMVR